MTHQLDFDRINHLLNPDFLADKRVTVVGLGSGGAPVCDHLAMNGVRQWSLFDPDVLEPVNLVKHPRQRQDLGRPKVDVQADWLLDRNPESAVDTYQEDVMESQSFRNCVTASDVVLACPDKKSVREFISDVCVEAQVPFVTASVFRTGIGGEVFRYVPGETGCYQCLQLHSLANDLNLTDDALGLSAEEEDRIYGNGERDFVASGLSIDIQMIALIQARMALYILLRGSASSLPQMRANWIIFANRPAKGIFTGHFDVQRMQLSPQRACRCAQGEG